MSNKTNTDNNELALTPDNYVGEVQDIQARQAIEALGKAVQTNNNAMSTIQSLLYGGIVTQEQFKQEMVLFKQEMRATQKEDMKQAVAENNIIVERRKKKYEKAYNSSVYRILKCNDDECPKYILFNTRVRNEMKKKMEQWVGTRTEFYNDEVLFNKAMATIKKITIDDYDDKYKKWCQKLTTQYQRKFDNLKTNRQEMIEAYEAYFFNNQNK